MPWSAPVSPTSGSIISVSWATANVVNLLNWLRTMTGNADPPAGGYVLGSDSPTATSWQKVSNAMMSTNVVGTDQIIDGSVTDAKVVAVSGSKIVNGGLNGGNIIPGTSNGNIIADHTLNGDAKLVSGTVTGNASGSAIGTGVIHPNRLVPSSDGAFPVARSGTVNYEKLHADSVNAENALAPSTLLGYNSATGGLLWRKVQYDALQTTNAPGATQFIGYNPASGGSLEWQSPPSVTVAGVPTGMVALFRTAAEIPAGTWSRETTLDGFIPVAAGASADSITFNPGQQYGNSWNHNHTGLSLSVSANNPAAFGGSISGSAVVPNTNATTGQATPAVTTYVPGKAGEFGVSGSCSIAIGAAAVTGSATGQTGNLQWMPPMRAYVYARKN